MQRMDQPIQLDALATAAAAGLVFLAGRALLHRLPPLARHNVPAPVVGGLLAAITTVRAFGFEPLRFDTVLQLPLMVALFTAIGASRCSVPADGRCSSAWAWRRPWRWSRTWWPEVWRGWWAPPRGWG